MLKFRKFNFISALVLLTFLSACSGGEGNRAESTASGNLPAANVPPIADAGMDHSVAGGAEVILAGMGTDADGTVVSFYWRQVAGTPVTLRVADAAITDFIAPHAEIGSVLIFELTIIDDGDATSTDIIRISVDAIPDEDLLRPVAEAGVNQSITGGQWVILDGSQSDSQGNGELSWLWQQSDNSGIIVEMDSKHSRTPVFTAPLVTYITFLEFELIVSAGGQVSAVDSVSIRVLPPIINTPKAPIFGAGSATIQNRYMVWTAGIDFSYAGFGLAEGSTIDVSTGPIETIDGIAALKVISNDSDKGVQHIWLAQDIYGNVWQLRQYDALTGDYKEEDALYMPADPQVGEVYALWDGAQSSLYHVTSRKVNLQNNVSCNSCLQIQSFRNGISSNRYFSRFVGWVHSYDETNPATGFTLTSITGHSSPASAKIAIQPASQNVMLGTSTDLTVYALFVPTFTTTYQWYAGNSGNIEHPIIGSTHPIFTPPALTDDGAYWVQITTGNETLNSKTAHLAVIDDDGTHAVQRLYGYGRNYSGQLGDGSIVNPPGTITVDSNVSVASAGGFHSLYLKNNSTLMGMGRNDDGQLGDGSMINRELPVTIDSNVAFISAGYFHSLYIKTDGSLWGMGRNDFGELGNNDAIRFYLPTKIADNVVSASAGIGHFGAHSLFITEDHVLMGMGINTDGLLGDGTDTIRRFPIRIDSNVSKASAGNSHTLYVKENGDLYAMGWNNLGQLGDGTSEPRMEPALIDSNVAFVSAGKNQSYYIKNDRSLLAMGANLHSQLAGTTNERPILIDTDVIEVSAGAQQNGVYRKSDGILRGLSDGQPITENVDSASAGAFHILFVEAKAK